MGDSHLEAYGWVTNGEVMSCSEAGCVTVVTGTTPEAALRAVGADPDGPVPVGEVPDGTGLSYVSVAGPEAGLGDDTVVLVEDNGWEGSRPDVLKRLSKVGKAASVFWNVDGLVMFVCARRGKVLAGIELPDPDLDEELPATLRRTIERAPDGPGPVALALVLVEKFTGVSLPQVPAVAQPTTAYPVTEPVLDLRGFSEDMLRGEGPGPSVVDAAHAAAPDRLRTLAEWAARCALLRAGVDSAPAVASALAQFGAGRATRLGPETNAFRREADRLSRAANEALAAGDSARRNKLWRWNARYWALEALAYTAVADDLRAALGATYCASIPYGADRQTFLEAAAEVLAT